MSFNEVFYTYLFGFREIENEKFKCLIERKELFPEKILHFTAIRSIKIWFGNPPEESEIKSLLGIQVMYINYFTGERKITEYQGAQITEENIENKELLIEDDDYLSKFYIGCNQFITHIKFETKMGKFIEFGTIDDNYEKATVNDVNEGKNIIVNIRGYSCPKGIRSLGMDYMTYKNFFYNRFIDLFRLRHRVYKQDNDKYKDPKEVDKLSYEMKCVLKICQLPDTLFPCIIK